MRAVAQASLVLGVVVLSGACGGDDDEQQAETASAENDSPGTTLSDDDGDGADVEIDIDQATECVDDGASGGEDDESGEGDSGSTGVDIGDDGISIEDGDGSIDIGEGVVDVETGQGQVSVGEGGISIDGCFGSIDVEAGDDGITISGPEGSVVVSPGDAVAELGGEDTPEGIAIPLAESVLFDFDSAALRPESGQQLSLVAGLAATYPDAQLEIGGHTDAVGDDAYNQQLSDTRAGAVRDGLGALGVATDRVTATGYGETRPITEETTPDGADDPAGRQQNRRVEILLVGADL